MNWRSLAPLAARIAAALLGCLVLIYTAITPQTSVHAAYWPQMFGLVLMAVYVLRSPTHTLRRPEHPSYVTRGAFLHIFALENSARLTFFTLHASGMPLTKAHNGPLSRIVHAAHANAFIPKDSRKL